MNYTKLISDLAAKKEALAIMASGIPEAPSEFKIPTLVTTSVSQDDDLIRVDNTLQYCSTTRFRTRYGRFINDTPTLSNKSDFKSSKLRAVSIERGLPIYKTLDVNTALFTAEAWLLAYGVVIAEVLTSDKSRLV